jgi:hypothetical protein
MSIQTAIALDIMLVCAGAVILHFAGGLRLSHPAVLYLMFHVLVFTARAAAISLGAPTFLSNVRGLDAPSLAEITQALIYADAMLVATIVGWLSVSKSSAARLSGTGADVDQVRTTPLSDKKIWWICGLAGSIGIYAFGRYAFIPGGDPQSPGEQFSDLMSPSIIHFLSIAMTWPGLVLLILIYRYGFRFYLLAPMAAYLFVIAMQGYDRFRLVIPLILLCMIYLDRRGRRWPGVALVAGFLALVALFVPLKSIGRHIQAGGGGGEVVSMVSSSASDSLLAQSSDQVIMDELAITIALADQHGRIYFGEPYLSTLLLPIPRSLWPDKPSGADHIQEISTSARPLRGIGGVTTLVGDLYLNFRLPGLLIIAFWLARRSGVLHRNAYRLPYLSVQRFSYLLFASILVQVFRDGLLSLPLFLLVHFLPLTALALVHIMHFSPALSRVPAPTSVVGGVDYRGTMVDVGERGLGPREKHRTQDR